MALTEADNEALSEAAYGMEQLQYIISDVNKTHGWHDKQVPIPEAISLMHSELSEALEEYRKNASIPEYEENGKPEGYLIEIADLVIRAFDHCDRLGFNLGEAIVKKVKYNDTRPYRHGGKTC